MSIIFDSLIGITSLRKKSSVISSFHNSNTNNLDQYGNLFENYEGRTCHGNLEEESFSFDTTSLPSANTTTQELYEHKKGFGETAYLFDYLDPVLQKEITNEFKRIYNEARNIKDSEKYIDIYDLNTIFKNKKFSNSLDSNLNVERMTDE